MQICIFSNISILFICRSVFFKYFYITHLQICIFQMFFILFICRSVFFKYFYIIHLQICTFQILLYYSLQICSFQIFLYHSSADLYCQIFPTRMRNSSLSVKSEFPDGRFWVSKWEILGLNVPKGGNDEIKRLE